MNQDQDGFIINFFCIKVIFTNVFVEFEITQRQYFSDKKLELKSFKAKINHTTLAKTCFEQPGPFFVFYFVSTKVSKL